MADHNDGSKVPFEDRMEALTMNLELMWRDIEALRQNSVAQAESMAELRRTVEAQGRTVEALSRSVSDLNERTDVLVTGTMNLLRAAEAYERRIINLEKRTA